MNKIPTAIDEYKERIVVESQEKFGVEVAEYFREKLDDVFSKASNEISKLRNLLEQQRKQIVDMYDRM